MATLSVLRFPTTGGAELTQARVQEAIIQGRLEVLDACLVTWNPQDNRPVTRPCRDLAAPGLGEAFWSLLFGHLFFLPLARRATGATLPANDCSLTDVGISDGFVRTVRERVHEGTSALFLLTPDATVDRVIDLLEDLDFTATSTNLTRAQESSLRAVFAGEAFR